MGAVSVRRGRETGALDTLMSRVPQADATIANPRSTVVLLAQNPARHGGQGD